VAVEPYFRARYPSTAPANASTARFVCRTQHAPLGKGRQFPRRYGYGMVLATSVPRERAGPQQQSD
jgi:hypothetical protein